MSRKIIVFSMLVTLHSLFLVLASLFTYRWYVDETKDVGIFGICEYLNMTTLEKLLNGELNSKPLARKTNQLDESNFASFLFFNDSNSDELVQFETQLASKIPLLKQIKNTVKLVQSDADHLASPPSSPSYNPFTFSKSYQKCYQLLWPDCDEAFQYLSSKPVFLTAIMGVAILSASLGFLTFIWSSVCIVFDSVGSHARSGDLLIVLSILTDISTIATFSLFIGKDDSLHTFKYYGLSFWLSVAAACGFFLASILFTVNRINIGFKYMLRNYQNQFSET